MGNIYVDPYGLLELNEFIHADCACENVDPIQLEEGGSISLTMKDKHSHCSALLFFAFVGNYYRSSTKLAESINGDGDGK